MTTFTTIGSGSLAVGKPITSTIGLALRDNPIAIAEADSSVAANLLPTVLLGTITTTSGTSQSLTGLTLTPYKFLRLMFNDVSASVSTSFTVNTTAMTTTTGAAGDSVFGMVNIDLGTGVFASATASPGGTNANAGASSISNATTTITIAPGTGNFDLGSVRVYGIK